MFNAVYQKLYLIFYKISVNREGMKISFFFTNFHSNLNQNLMQTQHLFNLTHTSLNLVEYISYYNICLGVLELSSQYQQASHRLYRGRETLQLFS